MLKVIEPNLTSFSMYRHPVFPTPFADVEFISAHFQHFFFYHLNSYRYMYWCLYIQFDCIGLHALFLCQRHMVFLIKNVLYTWKSEIKIPPALFFFMEFGLSWIIFECIWILGDFYFFYFSASLENFMGILVGIALNL